MPSILMRGRGTGSLNITTVDNHRSPLSPFATDETDPAAVLRNVLKLDKGMLWLSFMVILRSLFDHRNPDGILEVQVP